MVIYGEYLFLENFITGFLLLLLTAHVTGGAGKTGSILRLAAAAFLCGAAGFTIFLPVPAAGGLLLRSCMSLLVTAAAFGREQILKKTAIFLIFSFLSGGTAMALFLWMQVPALSGNGVLYVDGMTYVRLICCGMPAMGFSWWFGKLILSQVRGGNLKGMAVLEIKGKSWKLPAVIDTGNSLREPVTGNPVILTDRKGKKKLGFSEETWPERFVLIPYHAVGTEHGWLPGVRLDKVCFAGKEERGAVLAFYKGTFRGFDILLNRELSEGGLLDVGEEERAGDFISAAAEVQAADRKPVLHRGKRCASGTVGDGAGESHDSGTGNSRCRRGESCID